MDQLITQASAPASAHTPEAVAARVQRMARSYAQARLTHVSGYWRGEDRVYLGLQLANGDVVRVQLAGADARWVAQDWASLVQSDKSPDKPSPAVSNAPT